MTRWTTVRELVQQQLQLLKARWEQRTGRLRWTKPLAPPLHVPADDEERGAQMEADAPAGKTSVPVLARRRRRQQPQDVLGHLLQHDTASQQLAEQLWWKWRHVYLPAKQADLERRRGGQPQDAAGDDGDE